MENVFLKNPILLNIVSVELEKGEPNVFVPNIKYKMLFIGDVPKEIHDAVTAVAQSKFGKKKASSKSVPASIKSTLNKYYGQDWEEILGLTSKWDDVQTEIVGSEELIAEDIIDLEMGPGDSMAEMEMLDITETSKDADIKEIKQIKEDAIDLDKKTKAEEARELKELKKLAKDLDIEEDVKRKPVDQLADITAMDRYVIVDDVFLYPEDNIAEMKDKIFIACAKHGVGKIAPYKQHIYSLVRDTVVPMRYKITGDATINIDIREPVDELLMDLPVDKIMYKSRDSLQISAYDQFITLENIYNTYGGRVYYMVNIDEYMGNRKTQIEAALSDGYQFDIIYYSFVMKYWPTMSPEVFREYIKNESGIHSLYPELSPQLSSLTARYKLESQILNHKYKLLTDAASGYREYPKFRKYYPEFTETKYGMEKSQIKVSGMTRKPKDAVISVSIRQAHLEVDKARVTSSLSNSVQLNVRNLFQKIRISDEIPLMKLHISRNNLPFIYTKLKSAASADSDILSVYEHVKYQLQLPNDYSVLMVINVPQKLWETKNVEKYIILELFHNGRYNVRALWKEEDRIEFSQTYIVMQKTVNPIIDKINNLGRSVFSGISRLNPISKHNSKFSFLSLSLFWKYPVNRSVFNDIRSKIQEHMLSRIVKKKPTVGESDVIDFYIHKGVTQYDTTQIEKSFAATNKYAYLFDAMVKQRWDSLFGNGRSVSVHHRATDLKVDIHGIREEEFDHFYNYITSVFYNFETAKKSKSDKTKAEKAVDATSMDKLRTKNVLRLLKNRDPDGFTFKQFGSNIVYSRICQKDRQPIPYTEDEVPLVPAQYSKKLVKYWNYTTQTPMYYLCPNPEYPYLSFMVGQHPKGFCLPCCKKNPAYKFELTNKTNLDDLPKKDRIYHTCLLEHEYQEEDVEDKMTRYIMNYGKDIDIGRIGKLPDVIDKYLLYNIEDRQILSDSAIKREFTYNDKVYSVDKLLKITKTIKTYQVPVDELKDQLKVKSWSYTTPGKGEISAMEVLNNPKLSPNHHTRIVNADLKYPILIYRHKKQKWRMIVDGMHRLAKAYMEKVPKIAVRYVTDKQLDKVFLREEPGSGILSARKVMPLEEDIFLPGKKKLDSSSRKKGGADLSKKPGYYLYGVPQHTANLNHVGCVYSIAAAMDMSFEKFVKSTIRELLAHKSYFNVLMHGVLPLYFQDARHLTDTMMVLLLEKKIRLLESKFTDWNDLFIDVARIIYDKNVIILEDLSIMTTGTSIKAAAVAEEINIILPDKIEYYNDIIPAVKEASNRKQYILITKRPHKVKSPFKDEVKTYYPIFIFIPQIFFKTADIEQKIYTQNDEIMRLIRSILKASMKKDTKQTEPFINLRIVAKFVKQFAKKYNIHQLFINRKNTCYAVILNTPKGMVHLPVNFSYYKTIGDNLFKTTAEKSTTFDLFKRQNYKISYEGLEAFIADYNKYVLDKSENRGMVKFGVSEKSSREEKIIPIYPLIKVDKFVILGSPDSKTNKAIGITSGGMNYYFNNINESGFPKVYNTFWKHINPELDASKSKISTDFIKFVYYDPDDVNMAIQKAPGLQAAPKQFQLKTLNMAMYQHYMYQLFVLQFITYFDRDQNTVLRKKITSLVKSSNFKKPDAVSTFQTKLNEMVVDSVDRSMIMNRINDYFYTHFDKSRLVSEIMDQHYQFDRIVLNKINQLNTEFMSNIDANLRKKAKAKIHELVKSIVGKITQVGTPSVDKESFDILVSCLEPGERSRKYCINRKLVLPASKIKDFTDILVDDLMNPLKNIYLMSSIFVEGNIDYFKFDKVPGEDVYVKF